jgi:hypothetical protein
MMHIVDNTLRAGQRRKKMKQDSTGAWGRDPLRTFSTHKMEAVDSTNPGFIGLVCSQLCLLL